MHARSQDVEGNRLRSQIDEFIEQGGVHGITVRGSTGEFALLSEDERREMAEVAVDAAGKRVPVVVGTSAIATRTAVALSRHAAQAGGELMGKSLGPPRLPLRPLGKADRAALRTLLAGMAGLEMTLSRFGIGVPLGAGMAAAESYRAEAASS